MLTRREDIQLKLHVVTIEDLVPADDILRKIDRIIDFSFIYAAVSDLYSAIGRPSIDPVMLVKYLLLGYLEGIESERRIEQEIQRNYAYRWFLGLDIGERVPDHSTISQNRRRRFQGQDLFRRLFEQVLFQCMEQGLIEGKLILTDSTHIKANASKKSELRMTVERETAWYMDDLDRYETAERERLTGQIKPKRTHPQPQVRTEYVEKSISITDPEAGRLNRPGKPEGPHYLSHQSLDAKHGIIVDVAATPGNVTDGTPYLSRLAYMCEGLRLPIEAVGVDSAYDIGLVHQTLSEQNIEIYTPPNEEKPRYKSEFTKQDFQYDEVMDQFICPAGCRLSIRRIQRGDCTISREYKAKRSDCKDCSLQEKCLAPSQASRRIQVNIFEEAVRKNHEKDGTAEHKRVLDLRQIWCEGTFAAQKERHNLRRMFRRGLQAAEDHCLLSATAMNLKRMVKCLG